MLKEACVETLEQAINAERLGADRLELCSRLDLDGLTPDVSLYRKVKKAVNIPIHVMIRIAPRRAPDDFVLTNDDLEEMDRQMRIFKDFHVDGFVLGGLDVNKQVSIDQVNRLCSWVDDEKLVFHKAIDQTDDPIRNALLLEEKTNVTHLLTSGGALSAWEGKGVIKRMQEQLKRIVVIVAGCVTNQNLSSLDAHLSASEYHGKKIVGDL